MIKPFLMENRNKEVVVIVDFDNFFPKNMKDYSEVEINAFFINIVDMILKQYNNISFVNIRLYGGWYKGVSFTQKASLLSSMLAHVNVFPVIVGNKKVDGNLDMVHSLYGLDGYIWHDTFREKAGLQKFRIDSTKMGDLCSLNENSCAVKILDKFIRKQKMCHNAGCTMVQQNVFIRREQKMIDTMMACDIIAYGEEDNISAIFIVSDDVDIFPSIALCNKRNPQIELTLIIKNHQSQAQYSSILSSFNTKVVYYEKYDF